ncbi:MAG: enoyl-CoA hydratase/isomerase family protein [Hyphomicrobiales bacterium]
MEYEQITYEKRGHTAIITMNRPERLNAWTWKMARERDDATKRANEDPEVASIILTGAGRGFCAGADVRDAFQQGLDTQGQARREERRDGNYVELIRQSKPTIAAVNGVCVGVGLTSILPMDIIVASENARFGMFFVKMGLVPELASTYFLTQRVGFAFSSDMCLTGRLVEAEEAGRIGLVNKVVPHDQLMEAAMEYANMLAANPNRQMGWIKDLITKNGANPDYNEVMALEHARIQECYSTPEHREAVTAFQQKRPPVFR